MTRPPQLQLTAWHRRLHFIFGLKRFRHERMSAGCFARTLCTCRAIYISRTKCPIRSTPPPPRAQCLRFRGEGDIFMFNVLKLNWLCLNTVTNWRCPWSKFFKNKFLLPFIVHNKSSVIKKYKKNVFWKCPPSEALCPRAGQKSPMRPSPRLSSSSSCFSSSRLCFCIPSFILLAAAWKRWAATWTLSTSLLAEVFRRHIFSFSFSVSPIHGSHKYERLGACELSHHKSLLPFQVGP